MTEVTESAVEVTSTPDTRRGFVYHCHILEHEDEGKMRPFTVMPAEVLQLMPHGAGGHRGAA